MEKVKKIHIFKILFIFIILSNPSPLSAEDKNVIFSTWEGLEPDKCASVWLIKRFIDEDAEIRFFPKGSAIKQGIPFDTPDAEFRRYHNMSTYESLLQHYHLQDPKLLYIGKIIHDIEINVWDGKVYPETEEVKNVIHSIIAGSENRDDALNNSILYFDRLYQDIFFIPGRIP